MPAEAIQPSPLSNVHRSVREWAIGMTTAPRKPATLERSLESLAAAGWTGPRIFAEPSVALPAGFAMLPVTRREPRIGAFPNWLLGLAELVMRQPRAEAYMMCQDDVLFAAGLRDYLERLLWPSSDVGVVSAYCPGGYGWHERPPGFHRDERGWGSWGALAYVFPNPSARALLSDPVVINHRHQGPGNGLQHIDSVVGAWAVRTGRPYFVHVPSLTQHIGHTSTIYEPSTFRGARCARDFVPRID